MGIIREHEKENPLNKCLKFPCGELTMVIHCELRGSFFESGFQIEFFDPIKESLIAYLE